MTSPPWQETSLLLLTTPTDDPDLLLAPFQPIKMRVLICPIDLRLSAHQATILVRQLCPRHLILPPCRNPDRPHQMRAADSSQASPDASSLNSKHALLKEVPPFTTDVRRMVETVPTRLQLKRKFELALMPTSAAAALPPLRALLGEVRVARVNVELRLCGGQLLLSPDPIAAVTTGGSGSTQLYAGERLEGELGAERIGTALRRRGLQPACVRGERGELVIEIRGRAGTRIELQQGRSTICCQDYETGVLLREALLEQLLEL